MDLKKVYYTEAAVISLAMPFIVQIDDQTIQLDIPHKLLGVLKSEERRPHVIQELLFDKVKEHLGHGEFFLIPSAHQVELDAFRDAQMHHPENFPMDGMDEDCGCGYRD